MNEEWNGSLVQIPSLQGLIGPWSLMPAAYKNFILLIIFVSTKPLMAAAAR